MGLGFILRSSFWVYVIPSKALLSRPWSWVQRHCVAVSRTSLMPANRYGPCQSCRIVLL